MKLVITHKTKKNGEWEEVLLSPAGSKMSVGANDSKSNEEISNRDFFQDEYETKTNKSYQRSLKMRWG